MSTELQTHYGDIVDGAQEVRAGLRIADFEPFRHHVLVEPLKPDEKIGLIEIPESFRKKQSVGYVRAINPEDRGNGVCEVGDLVLFANSAGQDIELEGKALLILQYHSIEEGEILGRFPKQKIDSES